MIKNIEFIGAFFNTKGLPSVGNNLPEVVLCGRSNVGKSSFINSLFNKKNIAKTSSTPGKTRSLNYYLVDNLFYMVDLPGFGYAKVSKKERDYWNRIVSDYFASRKNITLAIHLVDCRYKPTELDLILAGYLEKNQIPRIVLLNKIDKLKQSEAVQAKKDIIKVFPDLQWGENLFSYSSLRNTGHKEVREKLSFLFKI